MLHFNFTLCISVLTYPKCAQLPLNLLLNCKLADNGKLYRTGFSKANSTIFFKKGMKPESSLCYPCENLQ